MKISQALTAGALLLFIAGNYMFMMGPVPEAPLSQFDTSQKSSNELTKQEIIQAESAIRRLQSEMATTNALLDRDVTVWKNDPSIVGTGLRGHNPSKHIVEMKNELISQTGEIASRLSVIDKDLTTYADRASRLPISSADKDSLQTEKPLLNKVEEPIKKIENKPPPPHKSAPIQPPVAQPPLAQPQAQPQAQPPLAQPLGADSPILMICFQRADYLERSLKAIKTNHPGKGTVPIVISQDGNNAEVIRVVEKFKADMHNFDPTVTVVHMRHKQGGGDGYHKLASHYGWALSQVFSKLSSELASSLPPPARVIILEEDLEIAPDFFDYFAATAPLLDDPAERLLAVSAWNDNGQEIHVSNNRAVYRSSFFPGLGWMLNRKVWTELSNKWPAGYWDDWLREPAQQAGREILRPEVCRTYHFAKKGVSNNQYSDFLTNIKLNREPVSWRELDLSYLKRSTYNTALRRELEKATVVSLSDVRLGRFPSGDDPLRVEYSSVRTWESTAHRLGIMDNVKAGVPRCAYHGIVTVRLGPKKRLVHVTLPLNNLDI